MSSLLVKEPGSSSPGIRLGDYAGLIARIAVARPRFVIGYLIVFIVIVCGLLAPVIAPYSPIEADPSRVLQPPSWDYLLGTDAVGMDIFSRTIYAPRIDLTIAISATLISAVIGSLIGALVGYYGDGRGPRSWMGAGVMRAADVVQAFPVFVLAIALVASLGQSPPTVVAAIAFVNIPIYLRLMRSQVLSIRGARFVQAARVAGFSDWSIISRHVIPNAMSSVLAQLSVNIGWAVLLTAGLSFVGAGVRAPTPEWGSMIAMGFQDLVTGYWWPSMCPGLVLSITVFGFTLVGASIEVLSDPAKRRALVSELAPRSALVVNIQGEHLQ
jgi:peptide/nickel transport system permease protein